MLSDERLKVFRRWCHEFDTASGLDQKLAAGFLAGNAGDLLAEVERLRSWLRECDVAIGGDGSDESLLGLVYTCGEGKAAMAEVERLHTSRRRWAGVLRRLEWQKWWDPDIDDGPWCPVCYMYCHDGHLEDCSLAAALKEASDE